jgi:hypothetical protein
MNIETTKPRTTTRRDNPLANDVLIPQQFGTRERDVREKGATRTTKTEEDDLYENVPCTD